MRIHSILANYVGRGNRDEILDVQIIARCSLNPRWITPQRLNTLLPFRLSPESRRAEPLSACSGPRFGLERCFCLLAGTSDQAGRYQ